MRKLLTKAALLALLAAATVGCGILYKQPIYQGSLLEKAQVEQLQAGMSKQQVEALIGSPSIADPFHHDRWDYTATRRTDRRGSTEVKNLAVVRERRPGALGRRIFPRAGQGAGRIRDPQVRRQPAEGRQEQARRALSG